MKKLFTTATMACILLLALISICACASFSSRDTLENTSVAKKLSKISYYVESTEQSEQEPTYFADVASEAWYAESIQYVYEQHLMNGVGGNIFNPEGNITRGMLVSILYRREGEPETQAQTQFEDVLANSYYENAVAWAAAYGIVNGYSQTRFGPNDPITREQIAAILYRYTAYKGYKTDSSFLGDSYSDVGMISDYAVSAMSWAVGTKLLNGMTATILAPQGLATRAQTATIIMRYNTNIATGTEAESGNPEGMPTSSPAGGAIDSSGGLAEVHPTGDDPENTDATKADSLKYGPYRVVFEDYDGTVLKVETVEDSNDAAPPSAPTRAGYAFVGWDDSYLCILSDKTLTAQYVQTDFPYQQSPSTSTNAPQKGDSEDASPEEDESSDNNNTPPDDTNIVGALEWPEDCGGNSPTILVGIVGAQAGDTDVIVPIVVRRNPGILGMTLSLLYDETVLELVDASNGSALASLNLTRPGRYVSQCRFMWDGQELLQEDIADGEILVLRFRIAAHAASRVYPITVFYNNGDIIDNNLVPVDVTVCNGSIRVM